MNALQQHYATAVTAERLREAAEHRPVARGRARRLGRRRPAADAPLVVRRAGPGDGAALAQLAQLDDAPAPRGPMLLAEHGGRVVAAVPLAEGRAIADPFHPTADLVAFLERRARTLRAAA